MSKKTLTLVILVFVLILVGLIGAYWYLSKGSDDASLFDPFKNFFPFGQDTLPPSQPNTPTQPQQPSSTDDLPAPVLRKITGSPVAGAIAIRQGSETLIRFVERSTSHVFETTGSTQALRRIANTTIPRIQEVLWRGDGQALIIRYLDSNADNIESFFATLPSGTSTPTTTGGEPIDEQPLAGSFLPRNMKSITANPAGTKIAYLIETSSGSSIYLSNFDGSGRERIYSSALSEWLVQWPDAAALSLTSKPSADVPGYLYSLTPSGSFVRQFGNISGMTTLTSPDRKEVLYAQSTAGVFSLNTFVRATGEQGEAPVATLPEKCVWSKDHAQTLYCGVPKNIRSSTYPDAWYQGLVSFSDDIWVIDLAMGSANVIATPVETAGEEIDFINPMLSPDEHYLIFMNKKDSSLWSLRLVSES